MRCAIAGPVAAALLLGLLLPACGSESKTSEEAVTSTPKPAATATVRAATSTHAPATTDTPALVATEEAVAPTSGPVEATECAAGITAELRNIDSRVEWAAYCPTFLPPGYAKELIGGPDPLEIRTVNEADCDPLKSVGVNEWAACVGRARYGQARAAPGGCEFSVCGEDTVCLLRAIEDMANFIGGQ